MTDNIAAAKQALRQSMLAARAAQPAAVRQQAADALQLSAPRLIEHAHGGVISGFTPFRDEIDTMPLLAALAAGGLRLAMPRVDGPHLTFHAWQPGDALVKGRYGQPEPLAGTPLRKPDVMLVPLLAFDRRGHRIGYGGGFFDRVLADYRPRCTIGLAYAMQQVAAVPVEPHDQPLDMILTERGLIDCAKLQGH